MKKKLLIFILILASIILTLFLRNYIRDKVNDRLIKKYKITLEENLIFDMDISEGTYKIARTYDLLPTDIHTNIPHELQNETITKEIFSKYSKEVNVNNKTLKYYGYVITEDKKEYIYTSIEDKIHILEHKIPLSKDNSDFIKQNLFSSNDIDFINIFPFKDEKHLFVYISHLHGSRSFLIVNLVDKTIKALEGETYMILPLGSMNLKENVVILRYKKDFLKIEYVVFDENGNIIDKYQ